MKKIRTVVIEDSGLMRIMISDALRADPKIEVVGTASNGQEGVEKVLRLQPDVVVTDMVMPHYDGLYAVKNIMARLPIPIILLSSLDRTTEAVFDALKAGAVEFIDKPSVNSDFNQAILRLRDVIKVASKTDSQALADHHDHINNNVHTFDGALQYHILVIGASTGGPSALESIILQLPSNIKIPVVIAQHMPDRFIESYAQRLSKLVPMEVRVARINEEPRGGYIYLVPGTKNMGVRKDIHGRVKFYNSKKQFKEYNAPSIDCLMESIADSYGPKAIGVILTGMGKDGSQGLLAIKKAGGLTIAQDEKSCIVNGMPQAARDAGAADHVVTLREIPGFVMSCF